MLLLLLALNKAKYLWNVLPKTNVPHEMFRIPSVDTMLVWTIGTMDQITNYSGSDFTGDRA
jgi:hypothetical protein